MWTGEAYLRGLRYAHQGKQDEGQEGGDGQGQSFSAPEECHENDGIGAVGFLWVEGEAAELLEGEGLYPRVMSPPAPRENRPFVSEWGEPVKSSP